MTCPHCQHPLTEAEVRSLHAKLANSKRTTKGGNPKPVGRRNTMIPSKDVAASMMTEFRKKS